MTQSYRLKVPETEVINLPNYTITQSYRHFVTQGPWALCNSASAEMNRSRRNLIRGNNSNATMKKLFTINDISFRLICILVNVIIINCRCETIMSNQMENSVFPTLPILEERSGHNNFWRIFLMHFKWAFLLVNLIFWILLSSFLNAFPSNFPTCGYVAWMFGCLPPSLDPKSVQKSCKCTFSFYSEAIKDYYYYYMWPSSTKPG
jgi:hypothetical protein